MASFDKPADEWKRWIAQVEESALDPSLPICDAHHHLWCDGGVTGFAYNLEDFHRDTGGGHNIVRSVYLECRSQYRSEGPAHLASVGETEYVTPIAQQSARSGNTTIAAIVGHANLLLERAQLDEVLDAHEQASAGLFKGIRYTTAQDAHPGLAMRESAAMDNPVYRANVGRLGERGLSYDAMVYHPQLDQLAEVAKACPQTSIVINHLGGFLGVGPYRGDRDSNIRHWRRSMCGLAALPNTYLKLGGIGMPMMGYRWDKQDKPPDSKTLADVWGDDIRFVIEQFGASRCLFESNFPVDMRGASYGVLWNAFKRITADCTPAEKRDLFHNTAARVYRIEMVD